MRSQTMQHDAPADAAPKPAAPKRGVGRPRSVFDEKLAIEHYQQGYSVVDVSKRHGVSMTTIVGMLRRNHITMRGPRFKKPKELPSLGCAACASSHSAQPNS